ncbi:UNVERIFIED_CONTAM: Cytochrome c-type biogenesis protein CcmE, mitochondrial [Sesamum radiatum]|uniref:Cytochrome c-type biogenesis protein CcmE, mitochondrial n=1 Tax=Sesamum radiatum TaxID=300843 RepID=A0AAW2UMS7_SESRA
MLRNSSKFGVSEKARNLDCYFAATEVLAKHDEKYMPAEVATAIEKNRKLIEEKEKKGEEALINATASDRAVKCPGNEWGFLDY